MLNFLPDLSNIGSLMSDVLALFVMFILFELKGFLLRWLQSHTTAKQRDVLHRVAEEAFSFAQTVYIEHDGPAKLAAATAYLSSRLKAAGISVTPEEMRAAIEKAYLAFKAATTQPGAPDPVVVTAQLPEEIQKFAAAASAFVATVSAPAAPAAVADKQTAPAPAAEPAAEPAAAPTAQPASVATDPQTAPATTDSQQAAPQTTQSV